MKKLFWTLLLLASLGIRPASAQQFAARSNLLAWMTGTVNLAGEVAVSRHSTLGVSVNYNPWTFGEDAQIQHWFVRPEYRYWFSEKYTRFFIGAHVIGGKFEVGGFKVPFFGDWALTGMRNNLYKGSAIGAGISFGYDFYVSPHWNIELVAGAGLARVSHYRESIADKTRTETKTRIIPIPTEIGVNFVYLFNSKK